MIPGCGAPGTAGDGYRDMSVVTDPVEVMADAFTYHPGNRTGTPEQRHPISLELASTAVSALAAAGFVIVLVDDSAEQRADKAETQVARVRSMRAVAQKDVVTTAAIDWALDGKR